MTMVTNRDRVWQGASNSIGRIEYRLNYIDLCTRTRCCQLQGPAKDIQMKNVNKRYTSLYIV